MHTVFFLFLFAVFESYESKKNPLTIFECSTDLIFFTKLLFMRPNDYYVALKTNSFDI